MSFDPELMQDFLTESGELLEQLDQDLVTLESTPSEGELVNRVFRALHTIKGSASFLGLTNLVQIAHAAETALNAARNKVFVIDRPAMDLLLEGVDTIKKQFDNIRAGQELLKPDKGLCEQLIALGDGHGAPAVVAPAPAVVAAVAPAAPEAVVGKSVVVSVGAGQGAGGEAFALAEATSTPFSLPPGKCELVEFLVADVEATLDQIAEQIARLCDDAHRSSAASTISDLAEALTRSVDFFGVDPMLELAGLLRKVGSKGGDLSKDEAGAVGARAQQAVDLLRETSKGLAGGQLVSRPLDGFCRSFIELLEAGHDLAPMVRVPSAAPAVITAAVPGAATSAAAAAAAGVPASVQGSKPEAKVAEHEHEKKSAASGEQTIRVEVGRLESLLNLVGELVLQKNRVSALGRQMVSSDWAPQEFRESVAQANGALDRVTADLQNAVMKTRMQPLEKLFGKYPRLIRDLARKLGKDINLVIEGGETEVDKSVIEELGDPLIHLMRNSCDHGIESPEARVARGKPRTGTIRLAASHEGSHVQILIIDDGKGIDPGFIARKALEKGVVTESQLGTMTDREKTLLIFAPGFSTAEALSDVSGRGVGMDVVRTNIEKLKGSIEIDSTPGQGSTMRITIPLTVAIMAAMMVAVGPEVYAVPLSAITEIVKPSEGQVSTIRGQKVMRLRDTVLPLLDGADVFKLSKGDASERPFAVVLSSAGKRVGLLVTRPVGQQEVVIKPLDGSIDRKGAVSGATVRDDGGVSLIVDIAKLFAALERREPG